MVSGLWAAAAVVGCSDGSPSTPASTPPSQPAAPARPAEKEKRRVQPTVALKDPVDLWKDGKRAGQVDAEGPNADDYVFLDLGDGWTPVLFTDGEARDGTPQPHEFRRTYLALARGEFPKDSLWDRARKDKYLELYGIMPTLSVLRERMRWALNLACSKELDLSAFEHLDRAVAYHGQQNALRTRQRYLAARKLVERAMEAQGVDDPAALDLEPMRDRDRGQVKYYLAHHDEYEAIRAAQARLECEGYFKGKGKWVKGAFDWTTHEALAEFERRHRVYSWGAMGRDTVAALKMDTAEAERETVLRVLTERAMHAFGAIEDGSVHRRDGTPVTFVGADGKKHEVPNLEAQLREAVVQAFGLSDAQATASWLDGLGELDPEGHVYVALPGPERPEYHASDMDLSVVIDRGDVWYEFPLDEEGGPRRQPVSRRPRTTLVVSYLDQKIPIARFGTTIGGWRYELIDDVVWWKYKGSPWGPVVWAEIVSAPVWLPPPTTPPRALLKRRQRRKRDEPKWEVNYHETGPSYASAYGLVAAYHREFVRTPDGGIRLTKDDGIRSHGSVDYMSIMRRHSHGCHRLHNHLAVRLFSFVVNHRGHQRTGHQPVNYVREFEYEEEKYRMHLKQGGYVFKLEEPIHVTVEEGRIRGSVKQPIEAPVPKFNDTCQAYYMPDGTTVVPRKDGTLEPTMAPDCDAGIEFISPEEELLAGEGEGTDADAGIGGALFPTNTLTP